MGGRRCTITELTLEKDAKTDCIPSCFKDNGFPYLIISGKLNNREYLCSYAGDCLFKRTNEKGLPKCLLNFLTLNVIATRDEYSKEGSEIV